MFTRLLSSITYKSIFIFIFIFKETKKEVQFYSQIKIKFEKNIDKIILYILALNFSFWYIIARPGNGSCWSDFVSCSYFVLINYIYPNQNNKLFGSKKYKPKPIRYHYPNQHI